jgi:uncharacterized YigZ family protein
MKDTYRTIAESAEGGYKEKGSKFLGFAFPVRNEAEIAAFLETLATKYYDARHHCYAWRLGPEGKKYRANDAGEPNHSAGDPILNEIKSRELFDVLVVVVRYFGGTKLGIPGLIEAYGVAAADALEAAPKTQRTLTERVGIIFAYDQTAEVGRVLQKFSLKPVNSEYGADCRQVFEVRLRDHAVVVDIFKEMGIFSESL